MNDNEQEFTIKCKMNKRWIPYFYAMLKKMEYLGSDGSSVPVVFYSDGDGDFRPKFEFSEAPDLPHYPLYTEKKNINTDFYFDAG